MYLILIPPGTKKEVKPSGLYTLRRNLHINYYTIMLEMHHVKWNSMYRGHIRPSFGARFSPRMVAGVLWLLQLHAAEAESARFAIFG